MLTIPAIVLGLIIIVSAIGADRSARSHHPLRAVVLNLCGIACLLCGLLTIYAWSHGGVKMMRRVAVAAPAGNTTTVVRLLVTSDGRLERPDQRTSSAAAAAPQTRTMVTTVKTEVKAEADHPSVPENAARRISVSAEPATAAAEEEPLSGDAPVDLEGLEELEAQEPEAGLPPDKPSQVQIDFDARPSWVDQPAVDVSGIHQISVSSGPYSTVRKARRELYRQLKTATDEYINEIVENPHASQWIQFSTDEIRSGLVSPGHYFDEKVISPSFGEMHQSHALLEFGPAFHNQVDQTWHQVMARTQLVRVALVGGAILGVLVLLFGYFNADTATRGFYSGRLKFVTVVAILGMIVAGLLMARSIPWLWL